MTENEKLQKAIEEEKELYEIMKDRYEKLGVESCRDRAEEHGLNIKWLEEIQQYRAIGTVEELINTQIREKVLNVELESYKEIGTIDDFKALKEEVELYRNLDKTNFSDGYNKAIDEMVDGIREILECNAIYNIDCISTLAEQMKGGAE